MGRGVELQQVVKEMFRSVRAHLTLLVVAGTTLVAGLMLAVAGLHMLRD